jgi:parallel beta-helix repeat protein
MQKKTVFGIMLMLVSVSMLTTAFNIRMIKASPGTIYIRADGSVEGTTYIQTADKVNYVFTANINDSIFVERSNIIIDGDGYALQGTQTLGSIGIWLSKTTNVTIQNAQVKAFWLGIAIDSSSDNKLAGNTMVSNTQGLYIYGSDLSDFVNYVDPSNTVNGKPVYYWISKQDMSVPLDAGFVVLVNCTRITAQNLSMEGILLAYTTNSIITRNNATNNISGLQLVSSSNNTVSGKLHSKQQRGHNVPLLLWE